MLAQPNQWVLTLGEIPADWKTKKLKFVTKIRKRIAGYEGPDVLSITQHGIKVKDIESGEGQLAQNYSGYQLVNKGDFAMNHMDLLTGYVDISKFDGVVSPDYRVFTNESDEILDEFLLLIFQIGYRQRIFFRYGQGVSLLGRWRFPAENFNEFVIPIPPLNVQKRIVDFLTDKTDKIDRAVKIKEGQIALLRERKQIIIQEAVTKGLNPAAPMKDSGIDWIGEIPAHWEVKRLKHISKIRYGLGQPPREMESGKPLIRATNVERGKISEQNLLFVDPEDVPIDRDAFLRRGEIIVVRSGAYTGDSAIIPMNYEGAVAGYDMVANIFAANSEFVALTLLAPYVLYEQLYLLRMRAAQPHLNKEELGETLVLLPPREEQQEIVKHIEECSAKVEAAIELKGHQIEALKEYKATLINAAVTGKIKVI